MITWKERVIALKNKLGRKPTLRELLEEARHHEMTPEEKEAQRRSWVIGNLLLDHPKYSREQVEWIYDNLNKSATA